MALVQELKRVVGQPVRRAAAWCHSQTALVMSAVQQPPAVPDGPLPVRRDPVPAPGDPLERALTASGSGLSPAELARLGGRSDAFVYQVWDAGHLVNFAVLSAAPRAIDEVDCLIEPANGAWWVFCAWTAPSHRGRGLYPRTLATMIRDACDAGATSVWLEVLTTNAASRRGVAKVGFEDVAELRCTRTLGRVNQSARLLTAGPLAQTLQALDMHWRPSGTPVRFDA